jgi:FPC/CPF motif-containing protein YcgG
MTNNAFLTMLGDLRKGLTVSELSDDLTDLIQLVRETGKKGAIAVTLQFTPASGGESVLVTADWSIKEPKPEKDSTTFFTTDDNALVRHDPRQREMFGVVAGQTPAEAGQKAS